MHKKYFILSILNSITQYFNYSLFGIGALQLSKEFLPGNSDQEKLVQFFAIVVLAVVARPLGSFIFGSVGDVMGRRLAIILSGLTSSLGTIVVFFIPSFNEIGIIATIILLLSRLFFICGLSGEIDGIRIYISETISRNRQNFGNGLVTFFTQIGPLTASSAIYFSYYLDSWRYCFLIGGILGFIFSFIRIYLPESSEFKKRKEDPLEYFKISISQLIFGQSYLLLRLLLVFGAIGSMYQFCIIFLPSYLFTIGNYDIKESIGISILAYGAGGLFWGHVADLYGIKRIFWKVLIAQLILLSICAYIVERGHNEVFSYLVIICSFVNSGLSVPAQIYIKNKINIAIRYRMFSFAHSLGSLLLSSPLPFICSNIAIIYGIEFVFLYPFIVLILAALSLISLFKELG